MWAAILLCVTLAVGFLSGIALLILLIRAMVKESIGRGLNL